MTGANDAAGVPERGLYGYMDRTLAQYTNK